MNLGILYAIFASIFWGLNYVLIEKSLTKIGPFGALLLYYIIPTFILIPVVYFFEKDFWENLTGSSNTILIVGFNVLIACIANIFIMLSIKNLDASTASILEITYPVFVVIFSYIIFKSIPNYFFAIGACFIMTGIFFVLKSQI